VLPFDNTNIANLANFNDVGFNTLKQSAAFAKIRANSKLFNTNIVNSPTDLSLRFHRVNKIIFSENVYADSNVYGNSRQHNLLSSLATHNNLSTFLNEKDLTSFLANNSVGVQPLSTTAGSVRFSSIINSEFYKTNSNPLSNVNFNVRQLDVINDSTDNKPKKVALNNIVSKSLNKTNSITDFVSTIKPYDLPTSQLQASYKSDGLNSKQSTIKNLLKGESTTVLSSDQLIRNYENITLNSANPNLSNSTNVITSFLNNHATTSTVKSVFNSFNGTPNNMFDVSTLSKMLARRAGFGYPHPLFFSNNPSVNVFEYDTNITSTKNRKFLKNKIVNSANFKHTQSSLVIYGDQTAASPNISTAY